MMKTNRIMDEIRRDTPAEVNKQVDLCYAIANRVYELMEEKGMKQRDLARAMGKTETEVSRWLSGTHNLTIATIAKMAAVLGDDIVMPTTSSSYKYNAQMEDVPTMAAEAPALPPELLCQ